MGKLLVLFLCPALLISISAEPMAVRYSEGLVHGFLTLRSLDGQILADGDLSQVARADRVTSKLVFRFRDGSYHEETVVFSQTRTFRLVTDHLVQKGPSFPHQVDMLIDHSRQHVTVRYIDGDGKAKVADERMNLPEDLANGLMSILMKNYPPNGPPVTLSMVAATPKPRVVKLVVIPTGEEPFSNGKALHKATHFRVKVEIGGISGVVAPLVGKQPPDGHVWILAGDAPAFLKSESQFYADGPTWRIELTSPAWPPPASPVR